MWIGDDRREELFGELRIDRLAGFEIDPIEQLTRRGDALERVAEALEEIDLRDQKRLPEDRFRRHVQIEIVIGQPAQELDEGFARDFFSPAKRALNGRAR